MRPEDHEIINGKKYMMQTLDTNSNIIKGNILCIFKNYLKGKPDEVFMEIDVHLSEDNIFIPNGCIVSKPEMIREDGIYGTPDLIVEILLPWRARNAKISKKIAYEKYGVKEYWIVDPFGKSVDVYIRKDNRLELDDVYSTYRDFEWNRLTEEARAAVKHSIKVSLYDDLYVTLDDIFEGVIE